MKEAPTFPDDENGDVLRRMHESGDNFDAPRDIDFAFAFDRQNDAEEFASVVSASGYKAAASEYKEAQMWQAIVTHFMLPTHAGITQLETRLSDIAAKYGGKPDGWGCFGQP